MGWCCLGFPGVIWSLFGVLLVSVFGLSSALLESSPSTDFWATLSRLLVIFSLCSFLLLFAFISFGAIDCWVFSLSLLFCLFWSSCGFLFEKKSV